MKGTYTSLAHFPFPSILIVNGQLSTLSSNVDREGLSWSHWYAKKTLCLLVEGIKSLSQLTHQRALLNGHSIKATSQTCTFFMNTGSFHLQSGQKRQKTLQPELPGVQACYRVQPDDQHSFYDNRLAFIDSWLCSLKMQISFFPTANQTTGHYRFN